ncbi:MAG: hypothetical protein NTV34_10220 [Proteobacteria bacterium]|nr:hypothetical protein [Pseudomonadota bacterium]
MLHSISANNPPDRFVDALRLKFWRGAKLLDEGLYHRLKRTDATIQYVLSDGFHDQDSDPWPHQKPDAWQKHVETAARKVIQRHWDVVWEPWNEPDYWPGEGISDEQKFSQYLDAFLIAYRAVKAIDPQARFSGPSLSAQHWPRARRQIDSFLDFCSRHSLEVTDLSWHGFDDRNLHEFPQRVTDIRQLARKSYPSVNVQKILISEIISEPYFNGVGRSCWSYDSCWQPTLNGAVMKNTDGIYQPTPIWWANFWYASFIGQRFSGLSSHPGITASAAIKQGALSILLGFSAAGAPTSSQDILLKFHGLKSIEGTTIRALRLPDLKDQELTTPVAVRDIQHGRRNGDTYLHLSNVQVGDAYLVKLELVAKKSKRRMSESAAVVPSQSEN